MLNLLPKLKEASQRLHKFRNFYPVQSLAEFKETAGRNYTVVSHPDNPVRREPVQFGAKYAPLNELTGPIPEMGLLQFEMGFAEQSGFAFSRGYKLVRETTFSNDYLRYDYIPVYSNSFRRIPGTCLSLVSENPVKNYGHYLLDALPRLEIAKLAGWSVDDIDWFYVQTPPSPPCRQLIEALGIPIDKCIWTDDAPRIRADKLLATTFPGGRHNYPAIVPEMLRRPFEHILPTSRQRIYIPRRGTRKVKNDDEIKAISREFGLEIFNYKDVENSFEYFRSVDFVAGAHGADLATLAVCQPGTKVLELIPSDHIRVYYYTLSESAGLPYHYIVGKSEHQRPPPASGPSPYDFYVDPAEYRNALETLVVS